MLREIFLLYIEMVSHSSYLKGRAVESNKLFFVLYLNWLGSCDLPCCGWLDNSVDGSTLDSVTIDPAKESYCCVSFKEEGEEAHTLQRFIMVSLSVEMGRRGAYSFPSILDYSLKPCHHKIYQNKGRTTLLSGRSESSPETPLSLLFLHIMKDFLSTPSFWDGTPWRNWNMRI